jgi:hypothetical protein
MERVRISSDLVLFFDSEGRPNYGDTLAMPDTVEIRVRHWLSKNDCGTELHAFVESWYEKFDAKVIGPPQTDSRPRPEQFGLSFWEVHQLDLVKFVVFLSLIVTVLSLVDIDATPRSILGVAVISLVTGIGYLVWFHRGKPPNDAHRRYRAALRAHDLQMSNNDRHLGQMPNESAESYLTIFRRRIWHSAAKRHLDAEDYGYKAFPLNLKRKDFR